MTRFLLLALSAAFGFAFLWAVATDRDALAIVLAIVEMALGARAVVRRKRGQNPYSVPRSTHFDRHVE